MRALVTEPIEELTISNVSSIVVHATRSSLRRACSTREYKVVPAVEGILPDLVYIKEGEVTDRDQVRSLYSIHAIGAELSSILLLMNSATSKSSVSTLSMDDNTNADTTNDSQSDEPADVVTEDSEVIPNEE